MDRQKKKQKEKVVSMDHRATPCCTVQKSKQLATCAIPIVTMIVMIYNYDIYDGQPTTGYAETLADEIDCLAFKALQHNTLVILKDKTSTTLPCQQREASVPPLPQKFDCLSHLVETGCGTSWSLCRCALMPAICFS